MPVGGWRHVILHVFFLVFNVIIRKVDKKLDEVAFVPTKDILIRRTVPALLPRT